MLSIYLLLNFSNHDCTVSILSSQVQRVINFQVSPRRRYIEDITRLREDMDFMFEWLIGFYGRVVDFMVEILFLPREHKIHIFELLCNVLFIIWTF